MSDAGDKRLEAAAAAAAAVEIETATLLVKRSIWPLDGGGGDGDSSNDLLLHNAL